ncbi:hypothetical protein FF011L_19210 [Roseimaritima multifibrata]|uniref:Uncharacterized protein n=1 Tax=Roseimaritima multifibrata TaxID=1930274 RepID=A0A517ME50_9BACT|nr:hypothetical protein FF011L_19210 [Roseimaritima multifibrata]
MLLVFVAFRSAKERSLKATFAGDLKSIGDDFNPAHPSLNAVLLAQRAADTCSWRKSTETWRACV